MGYKIKLGVQRCICLAEDTEKAENKVFWGELYYLAPEVILLKSKYGQKSEAWALGMLLLEMTASVKPKFHEDAYSQ